MISKTEEKMLYKIIGQKEGVTITATTSNDVTYDQAKKIGITSVFLGVDKLVGLDPFIILPVTTKERWEEGTINFCPRCGSNLKDYELEQYASFDCLECDASMDIAIHDVNEGDE